MSDDGAPNHPQEHESQSIELPFDPHAELCDVCGSADLWWRNCKLLCRNCSAIVKSCADL